VFDRYDVAYFKVGNLRTRQDQWINECVAANVAPNPELPPFFFSMCEKMNAGGGDLAPRDRVVHIPIGEKIASLVEIFLCRQFRKSERRVQKSAESGVKSRCAKACFEDVRRFGSAGANVSPDMGFLTASHPAFGQQTHLRKVAFFNAGEHKKSLGQSAERLKKRGVFPCAETKRMKSKTKAYVSKMLYYRVDIFGA
jgi:hypothetical protein